MRLIVAPASWWVGINFATTYEILRAVAGTQKTFSSYFSFILYHVRNSDPIHSSEIITN